MQVLTKSLNAFGSEDFNKVLKLELSTFKPSELPLHLATTQGGLVAENKISVSILNSNDIGDNIEAKLAVFFDEIVGGCSCGDPPLQISNYCELKLLIDKQTAQAEFNVLND